MGYKIKNPDGSYCLVRRVKRKKQPNDKISIRTAPDGRKYEWHPTKGFRRWVK